LSVFANITVEKAEALVAEALVLAAAEKDARAAASAIKYAKTEAVAANERAEAAGKEARAAASAIFCPLIAWSM